ncbi:MAG: hypothetical protein IPK19_26455 [Chloroflexi bacterium]|nr:hypothetical protein [Chloroflexota bacterium]
MFFFRRKLQNSPLRFPPRTSNSLLDKMQDEKQMMSSSGISGMEFLWAWEDILKNRPLDSSFYTAVDGHCTIANCLSSQSVPRIEVIAQLFDRRMPWLLNVDCFAKGPYPLLRCVLFIPDNPADPLTIESPLNVAEGNVQDFCQLATEQDRLEIVVQHDQGGITSAIFHTPQIGQVLKRALEATLKRYKASLTERDFVESVRLMERTLPSPTSGLKEQNMVGLIYEGKA